MPTCTWSLTRDLHDQPLLTAAAHMAKLRTRAQIMLAHGITTARDLGGKGAALALRDAIQYGEASATARGCCARGPDDAIYE